MTKVVEWDDIEQVINDKIEEMDEVVEVHSVAYERDFLINDNLRIEAEIETKEVE